MNHGKTTIGALLSSVGKALTGAGILAQLTQIMPAFNVIPPAILTACWWITLAGVVLGVLGTALTGWFAADANTVNNIASSVDRINKQGQSIYARPAAENKPPVNPAK